MLTQRITIVTDGTQSIAFGHSSERVVMLFTFRNKGSLVHVIVMPFIIADSSFLRPRLTIPTSVQPRSKPGRQILDESRLRNEWTSLRVLFTFFRMLFFASFLNELFPLLCTECLPNFIYHFLISRNHDQWRRIYHKYEHCNASDCARPILQRYLRFPGYTIEVGTEKQNVSSRTIYRTIPGCPRKVSRSKQM